MDLIQVMEMFPDQEACIAHLDHLRWKGSSHNVYIVSLHLSTSVTKTLRGVLDAGIATIAIAPSRLHLAQSFKERRSHFRNSFLRSR